MKRSICLTLLWDVVWACVAGVGSSGLAYGDSVAEPIAIGPYRQLFVDDHLIAEMAGVRKVLNAPKRHPENPLIVADRTWEGETVYIRGSVIYDEAEGLFRMWYCGIGYNWRPGLYATSKDGVHWEKPELGLVEAKEYKVDPVSRRPVQMEGTGSKANNIVTTTAMRAVLYNGSDADPQRRYKGLIKRQVMFSADGLTWQNAKSDQVRMAGDATSVTWYDPYGERFVAFGKVHQKVGKHSRRSLGMTVSKDGVTWPEARAVLVPDERDDALARERMAGWQDNVCYDDGPDWHISQFYVASGFPYAGMYLGMLEVFNISGFFPGRKKISGGGGEDGVAYIELISSRDLENWRRVGDREMFIPLGEPNTWEAAWIGTTDRPLIVGDKMLIYYGGLQASHGSPFVHPEWEGQVKVHDEILAAMKARVKERGRKYSAGGIGLATLRLDGWVSVDAGKEEGTLTTKALIFEGKGLVINAKAPQGSVAVEILDQAGQPLSGFGRTDCDAFRGDAIRHLVTWQGKSDLSQLAGKPMRFRFYLRGAKLYSFDFQGGRTNTE